MFTGIGAAGVRVRLLTDRALARFGLGENFFLLVLAVLIGVVTAAAAVGFHELINMIRRQLYTRVGPELLYGRAVVLLIALPALGGLAVGLFSRFVAREREGHGIVDVMESVLRSGGVIRPSSALEKIITSAVTIGSGGSAGAEGPIVQIGAGIASGFGQMFRMARAHMPVLIGCGSAAGISAIFNSPIGGLLFTLEVILRDFSIRTLTPLVLASVIANFTTQAIFRHVLNQDYDAIFRMPADMAASHGAYTLGHVGNFALLGVACGLAGVWMTRLMLLTEKQFARLKFPRWLKPAVGGGLLGCIGVFYVLSGHALVDRPKFIPFPQYSMPAFYGDGYGAVQTMILQPASGPGFYEQLPWGWMVAILMILLLAKVVGTCLTLGSGGAGGIIAPSLFVGAVAGGLLGMLLQHAGLSSTLPPYAYALIGMGAVLAAVVHAPLASVLILVDVTHDYQVILPAMLATIIATGTAQLISRDSIYTLTLRLRGVSLGTSGDLALLRRMTLEQVHLEPATVVRAGDPFQRVLDMASLTGATDFVVTDAHGGYAGMVVAEDVRTALMDREAVPLLLVGEMVRAQIPLLRSTDSLVTVLDQFTIHEISRLPVTLAGGENHVIGLISRAALMRAYQASLAGK